MQISKRTQYGLRAAVRLAELYPRNEYAQSRDLAEREALPTKFLEQVLLGLRRGGLLESKVGAGGGYRLKQEPTRVTVADVLKALEVDEPVEVPNPPTPGGVAVDLVAAKLAEAADGVAARWTLADLADAAQVRLGSSDVMYHI